MEKVYHTTYEPRVYRIFKDGLRPAIQTGIQNVHYGVLKGNPNFVYFNSLNGIQRRVALLKDLGFMPGEIHETTLEIKLSPEIKLERDADQILLAKKVHKYVCRKMICNLCFYNHSENFYRAFFKERFDLDFNAEPTEENLVSFMAEKVKEELWDEKYGAYRTRNIVPPDLIRVINLQDLL